MTVRSTLRSEPASVRIVLLLVGAAALAGGLYGRFKGLGTWPLGVDEYYISRSIDNVLRTGLPKFLCGGYYARGLDFQYLVAGLRLLGWSPEFAGRFVAALSSLALLPAAYLLAARVGGAVCGWVVAILLCASVWEIEMARFARMYAPYQAVFAWYVVAYLRFTVDRHAAALWWMVGLSVLGVLTWEGGALLGLANLLAVAFVHADGRLDAAAWRRLAGLTGLLALLYLATRDLRGFTYPPAAPGDVAEVVATPLDVIVAWFAPWVRHPLWALALLLPIAALRPAWSWLRAFRGRVPALGGLCLALLLLMRSVEWPELADRRARPYLLLLAALFLVWLAGWTAYAAGVGQPRAAAIAGATLQALFGYPDVYDKILRPWVRTLPWMSGWLLAGAACAGWSAARAARRPADPAAAMLALVIVMALAIGITTTDRVETRYTFFLYPPLLVLAVGAVMSLVRRQRRVPALAAVLVPFACFAATGDLQIRHVARIDSGDVNFRVGMSAIRADHYYPRNDMRSVAEWLAAAVRPGDAVISGIPTLAQYYPQFDYFFLDDSDERYETYVCPDNRTERWSNHPVLYNWDALKPVLASSRRVYATLYADAERRLARHAAAAGWSVTRAWRTERGHAEVLLIAARSVAAQPGAAQPGAAQPGAPATR